MQKIHLLHTGSEIEIFYTLYPFIISNRKDVKFIIKNFERDSINQLSGDTLFFIRIFKNHFDDVDFVRSSIKKLKQNFNRVYFLDDSAGADSTHFEFIDLVDGYYKAKLLSNPEYYSQQIYGRQIFSNYYFQEFNVRDEIDDIREPISDVGFINKLNNAYNIGYGIYPKPDSKSPGRYLGYFLSNVDGMKYLKPYFLYKHRRLIETLSKKVNYEEKSLTVSARFRYDEYPNTIGYQRYLLEQKVKSDARFLTGIVPKSEYENELKNVFVTLSPFGYGEVCFRDFESVINGSLLLKPDMSHLKTTPDIYIPNETYIPLKWDGSDLLDKVDNILTHPGNYYKIVENARHVYRTSLQNIDDHLSIIIQNLFQE